MLVTAYSVHSPHFCRSTIDILTQRSASIHRGFRTLPSTKRTQHKLSITQLCHSWLLTNSHSHSHGTATIKVSAKSLVLCPDVVWGIGSVYVWRAVGEARFLKRAFILSKLEIQIGNIIIVEGSDRDAHHFLLVNANGDILDYEVVYEVILTEVH